MLPLCWCLAFCLGVALEIARPGTLPPAGVALVAAVVAVLGARARTRWPRAAVVAVVVAAGLSGIARAGLTESEAEAGVTGEIARVSGAEAQRGESARAGGAEEGVQARRGESARAGGAEAGVQARRGESARAGGAEARAQAGRGESARGSGGAAREGLVQVAIEGASAPVTAGCAAAGRPAETDRRWLLQVPAEICPLAAGDRIWIDLGDLAPREGAPWPGGAAIEPGREGATRAFTATKVWRAGGQEGTRGDANGVGLGGRYWREVAALRHVAVAAGREAPALGFVVASVLGQPAALAPERRTELRRAGLGHVVAVSGMNVAVAAALVQAPLLRAGLLVGGSLALAALLAWVPVLAYLGITGGAPPAVRAALMFGLGQAATLAGRPGHGMTTLALTAALLLAWRPAWATDPGLHLSLAAMAVLVHPDAPQGLVAQSVRVSWGTLPIVLVHFGEASLVGVVANVIAVPVFTLWVLPLGVLGLVALPWWGVAALGPAALGGQVVLDVAALAARAPEPPAWTLAGISVGVLVLRTCLKGRVRGGRGWSGWVPGSLSCALVLAVVVTGAHRRQGQASPPAWTAVGGPRSAAVVWPQAPGSRTACVRDPWLAPEAWPDLLAGLGFTAVARVEARRSPPAAAAVRAELSRAGMMAEGTCPEGPDLKLLAGALRQCQERSRQRRAVVRAGPGGSECWVRGRFVPLKEAGDG